MWPFVPDFSYFPFSKGSSQPRDWTQVSYIAGGFFTSWATREGQEYWSVAYPFSTGSSWPRNRTKVSCSEVQPHVAYASTSHHFMTEYWPLKKTPNMGLPW